LQLVEAEVVLITFLHHTEQLTQKDAEQEMVDQVAAAAPMQLLRHWEYMAKGTMAQSTNFQADHFYMLEVVAALALQDFQAIMPVTGAAATVYILQSAELALIMQVAAVQEEILHFQQPHLAD
jgi:hypothetical protein